MIEEERTAVLTDEIREVFRSHRLHLDEEQKGRFATYLELLERWNEKVNLTSIRDRSTMILRHFAEPAMAMTLLAGAGPVILDVGAGAGFPGLPMKILEPERRCMLVEANGKKATFLREAVDALELDEVEVLEGRFEEHLAEGRLVGPVHVLTARAWTGYGTLLGLASSFMAPGGRAIFFIGEDTLRAFRRHLASGPGGGRRVEGGEDWGPATSAGWKIRRVNPLPHLDRAAVVSLELPSE